MENKIPQRTNSLSHQRGKYPEIEVTKYVHYFQDGKITRAGKQSAGIKFYSTPDTVWGKCGISF